MNELMTLDGLIQRLTELREIAGGDCPVIIGKSFDSKKERLKFTMVSLDSTPLKGTQCVAMLVEPVPVLPRFVCKETKEEFESAFLVFEKRNPEWRDGLTDSTYYDIAEWYDEFVGTANSESLSDKAHEFAYYVWKQKVRQYE
ncbi:MAG: hypothetical protein J6Y37_14085 [Paludibacteraceae bacterium]|nr:hypothetical protein [Paludibacteraceae bacterium]